MLTQFYSTLSIRMWMQTRLPHWLKSFLAPWNQQNEAQIPFHSMAFKQWPQSDAEYSLCVQSFTYMAGNPYHNPTKCVWFSLWQRISKTTKLLLVDRNGTQIWSAWSNPGSSSATQPFLLPSLCQAIWLHLPLFLFLPFRNSETQAISEIRSSLYPGFICFSCLPGKLLDIT